MFSRLFEFYRIYFVVGPRYLKLRETGNHGQTLAFLHTAKFNAPFLLPWQTAVIAEHGFMGDHAEIVDLCERWGLTLASGLRLRDRNDRYLVAYANWWRVTAQRSLGQGSQEDFEPLLQSIDLSRVITAYKKLFPLAIHPNWPS
jgi:hypothetical protein